MIYLPIEQIFPFFVAVWVLAILILWVRHEWNREHSDWTITKDQLYKCDRCHFTFLAENNSGNVARCPRCNEICFRRKKKRF